MDKVIECSTTTKYDRYIIKWTIDELSLIKIEPERVLLSQKFNTCANKNGNNWQLLLNKEIVQLKLCNAENGAVTVEYQIYILNHKGDKNIVQERKKYTFTPTQDTCKYVLSSECNITHAIINSFKEFSEVRPEDNKLTLCCEVIEFGEIILHQDVNERKSKKSVFIDDYKNLWETKDAADVTLFVGDEEFEAHKIVLIARSPVFRAMFTNDTLEANQNIIKISDIDAGIVKAMLEYIYTDTVKDLDEVAFDLLAAADKYQLDHLKNLCEESLTKSINVTNVIQLLVWADRHHSEQLVHDVIKFFKAEEGVGLIATKEFEDMAKSYPHLSLSILRSLLDV